MHLLTPHPAPCHISSYLSNTPNLTDKLDGSAVVRTREILQCVQQVTLPFYILLTVRHLEVILDNNQLNALFLNAFISCLYMFRATSAHHQEDQLVLIHRLV